MKKVSQEQNHYVDYKGTAAGYFRVLKVPEKTIY